MQKRSRAREFALQLLYQLEFENFTDESVDYTFNELEIRDTEIKEFAIKLINGVKSNIIAIDALIEKTLVNWKLTRIPVADKTLLRLGIFEIVMFADIVKQVTISEIIKLAKIYSDIEAFKYINGILDRFEKTGDFANALRE